MIFRVQLNFWNFAVLFSCSALALNYWIRFKYLNDYAQLKEPPLEKPDVNELHPDVNTGKQANLMQSLKLMYLKIRPQLSTTTSTISCRPFEFLDL